MAKEIFIEEWKIQDYAGRRELSMKSEQTINGEHVYACVGLTSWFRLGKYLIKHDTANYLLGLTELMSRHECQDNVRWWDWDKETNTGKNANCVDEIVRVVNKRFRGNDYVEALIVLQKALEGYEKCLYISQFYRLRFDYIGFLSDRDLYQARLEEYVKQEHKRQIRETYPQFSDKVVYNEGNGVLYEDRLYFFHNGRFIAVPKEMESPLAIESMRGFILDIKNDPTTDAKFVTLNDYGFKEAED